MTKLSQGKSRFFNSLTQPQAVPKGQPAEAKRIKSAGVKDDLGILFFEVSYE